MRPFLSRLSLVCLPLLVLHFTGCSPVIELDKNDKPFQPPSVQTTGKSTPAPTPAPKTSTTKPTPRATPKTVAAPKAPRTRSTSSAPRWYEGVDIGPINLNAGGQPNWPERYDQYYEAYRSAFQLPPKKLEMPVELADGRTRKLVFENAKKASATFSMPGKGSIELPKEALGAVTRARLFRDDAAVYVTNRKVRFEKKNLDAGNVTMLKPQVTQVTPKTNPREVVAGGPTSAYKPYTGPGPSGNSSFKKPVEGYSGETPQVARFINDHIRDPTILKWFPVERDPRGTGFTQDVMIKAYGGKTLGYFQERKRIFMRDNGSVYRQMNIK